MCVYKDGSKRNLNSLFPSLPITARKVARRERIKMKKKRLHAYTRNEHENARDFMRVMHLYMRICIRKLSKCSANDIDAGGLCSIL